MCECLKDCFKACAKIVLIIVNVIALVAALALIAVGIYTIVAGDSVIPETGFDLNTIAYVLIVIGVLLLLVAGFGCFGACTGKHGLLNVYLFMVGVIVALLVACLIYGFVKRSEVEDSVTTYIENSFEEVKNYTTATADQFSVVNGIQAIVECCGTTGPSYWDWGDEVPASCCSNYTASMATDVSARCDLSDSFETGCLEETESLVSMVLLGIIIVVCVIIVFQLACMILACCSKKG